MTLRFALLVCVFIHLIAASVADAWDPNGNAICTALDGQSGAVAVLDGAGGAIIAWTDNRTNTSDIYAQRVNAWGAIQWTVDGVGVKTGTGHQSNPAIASDGSGGAIIFWEHVGNNAEADIYAQRINASGAQQWPTAGVLICSAQRDQHSLRAVADGSGGAIAVWVDDRPGSTSVADIYAQRIGSGGVVQWTSDGVGVCTAANRQEHGRVIADGTGGAIIAWTDNRDGTTYGIYARRINSTGTAQWTADGVSIGPDTGYENPPAIASDAAGGAIVTWASNNGGSDADILAQRLNSSGAIQWAAGGVTVCGASENQTQPEIVPDGAGGAVLAWQDLRNTVPGDEEIYAQRVNASGAAQWTADGVGLCTGNGAGIGPQIVSDGASGAVVSWIDSRDGSFDIYARRVNALGNPMWTADGVPLCTAINSQIGPSPVSDGFGGALVAWMDYRSGTGNVYANRVTGGGIIPTPVRDTPAMSSLAVNAYPNPFSGSTMIEVTSRGASAVNIDVFDVAGRRVRSLQAAPSGAATRSIPFDGRNEDGTLLPSGLYFCRVQTGGATVTRKIVIQR